jgi:Holliday junction resolvase-like predicted endonuclease
MTNYANGHKAETIAADYLKKHGYKIKALNWKTPRAEIDIIAEKKRRVVFFEVKYRATELQGGGLDYITAKKLEQMSFAAENWVLQNRFRGDYGLGAVEVYGTDFVVTNMLEDL